MLKVHDKVRIKPAEVFGVIMAVDEDSGVYTVEIHGSTEPARVKECDVTKIDEVEFSEISKVILGLDRIELFAKVMADHADDTRVFCDFNRDGDDIKSASIFFMAGNGDKQQVASLDAAQARELLDRVKAVGLAELDPSYGENRDAVGYRWRLCLYSGLYSIACMGKDAFPEQLPKLYRLFESYGVPTIWDDMTEGPYYTYAID